MQCVLSPFCCCLQALSFCHRSGGWTCHSGAADRGHAVAVVFVLVVDGWVVVGLGQEEVMRKHINNAYIPLFVCGWKPAWCITWLQQWEMLKFKLCLLTRWFDSDVKFFWYISLHFFYSQCVWPSHKFLVLFYFIFNQLVMFYYY